MTKGRDLPQGSIDLIVRAAVAWAEARRTPVLSIDPPPALPARMAMVGGLPLSHDKEAGQLYLANIGIPKNVFTGQRRRTQACRPAGGSGG